MKFPSTSVSGIGTMGATGVTLLALVGTGHIPAGWLALSIFFIIAGIGSESNKS